MSEDSTPAVTLGLGLIGIGRPWGYSPSAVPTETDALKLLEAAFDLGFDFFDTAPSYALSEERLGRFLRGLTPAERDRIRVATKFGDHWRYETESAFVDHSFTALKASLDRSIALLGRIDLLQLHKTTPAALQSDDVSAAFEYARSLGIQRLGVSVSDLESGRRVCASELYCAVQLPYNIANESLGEIVDLAAATGKDALINRPFNMGKLLADTTAAEAPREAFRFVLNRLKRGVILTGTVSPSHLRENWQAFHTALAARPG